MVGWGEPTHTLVPWRQGFRHPTRNEIMGWFAQIIYGLGFHWTIHPGPFILPLGGPEQSSEATMTHRRGSWPLLEAWACGFALHVEFVIA